MSSVVSHHRPGRRPLRSSTAPSTVPSVNVTQAGPSQGSISDAWNSANARSAGPWWRCSPTPPGSSSSPRAAASGRPDAAVPAPRRRTRSPTRPGCRSGTPLDRSPGISAEDSSDSRARIRFRLPRTVLISPLCAMNRNGWASGQAGKVLVENRECTIATALSVRSSVRSAKNAGSCDGGQHALVDDGAAGQRGEVDAALLAGAAAVSCSIRLRPGRSSGPGRCRRAGCRPRGRGRR